MSWHDPGLKVGEHVAGAVLTKQLAVGGGISVWAARTEDAKKTTVCGIVPAVGEVVRDRFLAEASRASDRAEPIAGVLSVLSVDPLAGAYVGALATSATLVDIQSFDWEAETKVASFRHICEIVARLHAAGITHGWLRPENVLFDATLRPCIANARGLDVAESCRTDPNAAHVHKSFTAPESRHGASAEPYGDVFSLGRILQFILQEREPDESDERLPRFESLAGKDNDLIRIVRRCTTMDTTERYPDAGALLEDLGKVGTGVPVGLSHPALDEDAAPLPASERVPAKVPVSKPSPVRSKAPPRSSLRPKRGKKSKAKRAPLWSPKRAVVAAAVGLLMFGGSVGVTYVTGKDHNALIVLSWLAAIPLGFALPSSSKSAALWRAAAAVVLFAALVFIDPVGLAQSGHSAGLRSPDLAVRVAAMKTMLAGGGREFNKVDLMGADLSGMNLSGARLDRAILRDCKCRGVNLSGASIWNVDVTNADFSAANLSSAMPDLLTGWSQTICDEATKMPAGWECRGGHPALIETK